MTATPLSLRSGGLGQNLQTVEGVPVFPGGDPPDFEPLDSLGAELLDAEDDFDATGGSDYALSEVPHTASSILVVVQGQVARKGINKDYVYESVGNKVVFRSDALPEVGMWVLIRYRYRGS